MAKDSYLIALDQGTTSSRAVVFDSRGHPIASGQKEFPQIYPRPGWVEHDADVIWRDCVQVMRDALAGARITAADVAAIGVTNQRETTVVWDRGTGKPIHNAIVWQDRRTAETCQRLRAAGVEPDVSERTGLLLDPYFSATKLAWILDHVGDARARAAKGQLAFGTIDCWLLWNLTGGKVHATDATNASRTMLFNIHRMAWDETLLKLFNIPASVLPEVKATVADYGSLAPALLDRPILVGGLVGDQQSAAIGQAAVHPGMVKSTYGTGAFLLLNTGDWAVRSKNRLLTTVAYQIGGKTSYAVEGSIFIAGAGVQWLRDALKFVASSSETEAIAASLNGTDGVYVVPAFAGLGAPYWDAEARGAVLGLTRNSGLAHIVRATLEAVAYQTLDLFEAMANEGVKPVALRVDGGMVANNWLMQFLADLLTLRVDRPRVTETTSFGAAYCAGIQAGLFNGLDGLTQAWVCERSFQPAMDKPARDALYAGWKAAVERVRSR